MEISESTWKRAAMMWWIYAKDNEQGMIERERLWRDAEARADSKLEMLIELEDRVLKCPSCGRLRDGHGLLAHAANCKLAKELDDDGN